MGYLGVLDALKIIGGAVAAMLATWGLLYSGSRRLEGRRRWLSLRVALFGAIAAGLFVLVFALWAYLHP